MYNTKMSVGQIDKCVTKIYDINVSIDVAAYDVIMLSFRFQHWLY